MLNWWCITWPVGFRRLTSPRGCNAIHRNQVLGWPGSEDSRPTSKSCSALDIAVWILEATESAVFCTQQIGVAQNGADIIVSRSRITASLDAHQFSISTAFFVMSPLKFPLRTVNYFKLRNKPNNLYQLGRKEIYIWDRWFAVDWIQQLAISVLKVVMVTLLKSCHTWVILLIQVFCDNFVISIHSFWM